MGVVVDMSSFRRRLTRLVPFSHTHLRHILLFASVNHFTQINFYTLYGPYLWVTFNASLERRMIMNNSRRTTRWLFGKQSLTSFPYAGDQIFNLADSAIVAAKPAIFKSLEVTSDGVLGLANKPQLNFPDAIFLDNYCIVVCPKPTNKQFENNS